jgi:hypothetical protein
LRHGSRSLDLSYFGKSSLWYVGRKSPSLSTSAVAQRCGGTATCGLTGHGATELVSLAASGVRSRKRTQGWNRSTCHHQCLPPATFSRRSMTTHKPCCCWSMSPTLPVSARRTSSMHSRRLVRSSIAVTISFPEPVAEGGMVGGLGEADTRFSWAGVR